MLEIAEFIDNGMHMINLSKPIIDAYDPWPSVCHLSVVLNFLLSVVVYDLCPTCHTQSLANDASYDPRPSVCHPIIFLSLVCCCI